MRSWQVLTAFTFFFLQLGCKTPQTGRSDVASNSAAPSPADAAQLQSDARAHVTSIAGSYTGTNRQSGAAAVPCSVDVVDDGSGVLSFTIKNNGSIALERKYASAELVGGYRQFRTSPTGSLNRSISVSKDVGRRSFFGLGPTKKEDTRLEFFGTDSAAGVTPLGGFTWQYTESDGQFSVPRVAHATCWVLSKR